MSAPTSVREAYAGSSPGGVWTGVWLWLVILAIVGGGALLFPRHAPLEERVLIERGLFVAAVAAFSWMARDVVKEPLTRSGLASVRSSLLVVGAFAAMFGFMWLYVRGATALGFRYADPTDGLGAAGWPLWAILAEVSLAPAVLEETAFRGVIQGGLARAMSPRDALVVQAAMFSVLHFSPIVFPSHFVMGLVFGLLRARTGSVYPGMIVHAAWNAYCCCS